MKMQLYSFVVATSCIVCVSGVRKFHKTTGLPQGRCFEESVNNIKGKVMDAVSQEGDCLQYASEVLKEDKEVVLAAVTNNGQALQYAAESLKADKEVVHAAADSSGEALQYATEHLRADKHVVTAAVISHGHALEYASDTLKWDKHVVLAAVKRHGLALQYAPEAMRSDKDVVLAAVENDPHAWKYASEALKNDHHVSAHVPDDVKLKIGKEELANAGADSTRRIDSCCRGKCGHGVLEMSEGTCLPDWCAVGCGKWFQGKRCIYHKDVQGNCGIAGPSCEKECK